MFNLKVICPECRIVNCYPFGSGDLISIGDYINNEEAIFMEKTYVREHKIKCLSMNNLLQRFILLVCA